MKTPRQLLGEARMLTFYHVPYLASYIYTLREHERPGIGTAAVDVNGNLYWDADYIREIGPEKSAYLIAHEALHLVFEHHRRSQELLGPHITEHQRFVLNVAADLVVQQTLFVANMDLWRPDGAVQLRSTVPQLGGLVLDFPPNLSMEQYYRLIMDRLRGDSQENDDSTHPQEDNEDGSDDSDNDDSSDGSDGDAQDDEGSGDSEGSEESEAGSGADSPSTGQSKAPQQPGTPGCGGSCADGQPREYEVANDGSWDAYGSDMAAQRAEQAMHDYAQSEPGSHIPESIKQAIGHKLRPQPDPFDKLRSAVATSVSSPIGGRDFSHRRLSRKQSPAPNDPLLHGRICTQPNAVVIVDTSGSMMGTETQTKALSVIGQGLRKLGRVKVICADTAIRSSKAIANTRMFEWDGGGGTDMARAIEDVDRTDKPDSIILITDAITGWPYKKPRARVVVAYTGSTDSRYYSSIPSWARTVVLQ